MKWTTLLLVLICAAMAFGGTFNCKSSSGDVSFSTTNP